MSTYTSSGPVPPAIALSESDHLPLALGRSGWLGAEALRHIVVLPTTPWGCCKNGSKQPRYIFSLCLVLPPKRTSQYSSWLRVLWSWKNTSIDFPLDPERTTYFSSLGVNDSGRTDVDELEPIVDTIFDAAHDLYVKAGARNFVFIDVPPVHRSPQAVEARSSDTIAERVEAWNDLLRAQAAEFEVLDDPAAFDLAEEDVDTAGGGIWEEDLHLTEHMHTILAERLLASLLPST